ncbi:hypothetical protein GIB67_026693 [Kingdonia uniflora]|uniref:Uncharacterized protein n=1 Tax=Kingdonia uniflora TaxID=39325 RepID=A0A7J7L1E3_9MAGN|nr:hypothetical protein GIB67_026693 [Kingdonia uniflora]
MYGLWDKMLFPKRRVLMGLASCLGLRHSGMLKLRNDIRTCEYEDVHVMWEMLKKTETDMAPSTPTTTPRKKRKRPLWKIFVWATRAPFICR